MNRDEFNVEPRFDNVADKLDNTFKSNYAEFIQRVFAFIIDGIVIGGICLLEFSIAWVLVKNHVNKGQLLIIDSELATITNLLYFSIMESSAKQATIGKKAIGIYVTDLQGNRITFVKALIRESIKIFGSLIKALFCFINPADFMNYLTYFQMLGYLLVLFLPKKQALHDIIAGTLVLKKVGIS